MQLPSIIEVSQGGMCVGEGHLTSSRVSGEEKDLETSTSARVKMHYSSVWPLWWQTKVYLHLLLSPASVLIILFMNSEASIHLKIQSQPILVCTFHMEAIYCPIPWSLWLRAGMALDFLLLHTILSPATSGASFSSYVLNLSSPLVPYCSTMVKCLPPRVRGWLSQ